MCALTRTLRQASGAAERKVSGWVDTCGGPGPSCCSPGPVRRNMARPNTGLQARYPDLEWRSRGHSAGPCSAQTCTVEGATCGLDSPSVVPNSSFQDGGDHPDKWPFLAWPPVKNRPRQGRLPGAVLLRPLRTRAEAAGRAPAARLPTPVRWGRCGRGRARSALRNGPNLPASCTDRVGERCPVAC